ncbi:MAG TPA: hypothetical protein VGI81_28730 [Tepidisphaeraceae bacterium]
MSRSVSRRTLLLVLAFAFLLTSRAGAQTKPFAIQVVDDQAGRGVPLVELRTVNNVRFYTDSAGLVAITDATLLNRRVFFSVTSDGYEFPKDGFGYRGVAIDLKSGGESTLKIKRLDIAERLYRITGDGIYRDSVLLGRPAPVRQPISNAQVAGQDSCQAAVFDGKIRWFWGDTSRLSYPLGHFGTAGATSLLPGSGGLDPSVGIDLTYYVGNDGFSRPTFPPDGAHPQWLDGLVVVKDDRGKDRLIGRVSRMKDLGECMSRSLVVFDDRAGKFESLIDLPLDTPLALRGHPFIVQEDQTSYIYCGDCFPNVRVKSDWASVKNPAQYEAFTCLVPGARYEMDHPQLERDAAGRLVWGWKRETATVGPRELAALIRRGTLKPDEACFQPLDVDTRKPIFLHGGSVAYNAFRKKWIMIAVQFHGSSSELGEVWYSEADKPEGPWRWARKVVTHDHYSFYNPVHHPFFDQQGGRVIYFEGTYSNTFSGNDRPTPRYDYNQMMYRLDLSDPRLTMPRSGT